VKYSSFTAYFQALEPLSGAEREMTREFLDPEMRVQFLKRFAPNLCTRSD
jgi:hypothetical protein